MQLGNAINYIRITALSIFFFIGSIEPYLAQCRYISSNEKLDATCPEYISDCKEMSRVTIGLSFAVKSNGTGYLILSHKPMFRIDYNMQNYFGNSFLLLDDESIIKLIHRGNEWSVNGEYFVRYNLTNDELQQLRRTNIRNIRYSVEENNNQTIELENDGCRRWSGESIEPRIEFPELINSVTE